MGCSISKLDPEGEAVPAKIRPLLRRRFEEITRLRNANALKSSNLSKKKLLKDGGEEDDHSPPPSVQDINEGKSISSLEGSVGSATVAPEPVSDQTCKEFVEIMNQEKSTKQDDHSSPPSVQDINASKSISSSEGAKVTPEPVSNKTCKEFVEIMNQEKSTKQDKKDEEKEEKKVVEPLVALEEVMLVETEEGEDEEDDEDERRLSNVEDAFICPGSPSFRVYCIQSLDIDKDDSTDDNTHKKSPSGDSVEISESINSSEDSETKIKKKARKGSRFRRVIPKGRPGAVRNLLNVKSCYNPGCSGHDDTSLLTTKAPA